MGDLDKTHSHKKCGLTELLVFLAAIASGTACSLCSKLMMELHSVGITGEEEVFEKPLFQTFGMFIGMMFGLVMHWAVVALKIPFPGYHLDPADLSIHSNNGVEIMDKSKMVLGRSGTGGTDSSWDPESSKRMATEKDALLGSSRMQPSIEEQQQQESQDIPTWMYFFLAIPSIFDLAATALCMMGLRYLDVSIYQMLRGSGIIFVALMKQHVLRHHIYPYQWFGVCWNVLSVGLVGATAMLNEKDAAPTDESTNQGQALLGVILVLVGAFVQAMQYVFEEKVMTMDIPSPPLLLIGMEGLWGTILCLTVMYPLGYYLPGGDHGSYEDPFNTWVMIKNSSTIQWAFVIYFFAIFFYNLFAVLVTFMLNSVWHAILDNFRPITVWGTDMFIYYVIAAGTLGEPWTKWSFVQLVGMFVLLYGTAVYNAPNAGSIKLEGQWYALGFDFTEDYQAIETAQEEAELDAHWEQMQKQFVARRPSSFLGEISPFMSVHTQSLRGLASPKI